jgi:hypothetical protein
VGGGGGGIAMASDAASAVKNTATATDKTCRPKIEWIGLISCFLFYALEHSWPGACFLGRKPDAPPTWVRSNASDGFFDWEFGRDLRLAIDSRPRLIPNS